jgi:hypothetical protein
LSMNYKKLLCSVLYVFDGEAKTKDFGRVSWILRKVGESLSAALCRLWTRQLLQLVHAFTPGFGSSKSSHNHRAFANAKGRASNT